MLAGWMNDWFIWHGRNTNFSFHSKKKKKRNFCSIMLFTITFSIRWTKVYFSLLFFLYCINSLSTQCLQDCRGSVVFLPSFLPSLWHWISISEINSFATLCWLFYYLILVPLSKIVLLTSLSREPHASLQSLLPDSSCLQW